MKKFLEHLAFESQLELRSPDRSIAPLVFALSILLVFAFCFNELPDEHKKTAFVAMLVLTQFLGLQIYLSRAFEAEMEDNAFDMMRVHPVNPTSWFFSKVALMGLFSFLLVLPVSAFGCMIFDIHINYFDLISMGPYIVFGCLGISSLGVVLAAITISSSSQKILFPVLFFPLSVPIILSIIFGCLQIVEKKIFGSTNWVYLLIAFDVIYTSIGWLLFHEIVGVNSSEPF